MARTYSSRWWALALRGVAAILFGILTFISPGSSVLALVFLFGAYAIVNGAFTLAAATRGPIAEARALGVGTPAARAGELRPGVDELRPRAEEQAVLAGEPAVREAAPPPLANVRWGSFLLEGVASIVAGVLSFIWPGITALVLVLLIGAWAVVTGVAQLVSAIRLRKTLKGEWLLVLSGILSLAFGVLLFLSPLAGALAVVFWIGAYAIVFGVLQVVLGFRLRSREKTPERRAPAGGVPTPA